MRRRTARAATGLYADGMGRTTNGSGLGQWSGSGSTNQQFRIVPQLRVAAMGQSIRRQDFLRRRIDVVRVATMIRSITLTFLFGDQWGT